MQLRLWLTFLKMKPRRTRIVPLFPLPSLESLPYSVASNLRKTSENLERGQLSRSTLDCHCVEGLPRPPREAVSGAFRLWHPLSEDAILRAGSRIYDPARTRIELGVFESKLDGFSAAIASDEPSSFSRWLNDASVALGIDRPGIRRSDIFTRRNTEGFRSKFPSATMIDNRMEELHRFIRRTIRKSPLFSATVAMVAMTNCHPFHDGNGRMSRILFNVILHIGGVSRNGYVPMYEMLWISGFGFEIRVMSAESFDCWEPLFSYMKDLSDICFTTEQLE
jgi:hypothetical protein